MVAARHAELIFEALTAPFTRTSGKIAPKAFIGKEFDYYTNSVTFTRKTAKLVFQGDRGTQYYTTLYPSILGGQSQYTTPQYYPKGGVIKTLPKKKGYGAIFFDTYIKAENADPSSCVLVDKKSPRNARWLKDDVGCYGIIFEVNENDKNAEAKCDKILEMNCPDGEKKYFSGAASGAILYYKSDITWPLQ